MKLAAMIRAAARRVVGLEDALYRAQERYAELVSLAHDRGVRVPRTRLTNPCWAPQKKGARRAR